MRTISLFSGCGGFDLGAEQAGAEIIFSNDVMADACATLKHYFPHSKIVEDSIANVDEFPEADLVIGGYPCQSFSMGGNRNPLADEKTYLYQHFARCIEIVQPKYFIAENVNGLQSLRKGKFLEQQVSLFENSGSCGYRVFVNRIDAKDYGVPQARKRVFIVGVRRDLDLKFVFPQPTHGKVSSKTTHLLPYKAHGDVIQHLPLWPNGEFYERPHDLDGNWSWYYMSRNRKRNWDEPSFTVVANWRHITVHPASPVMKLTWSNLSDGFKQRWDFTDEYEHIKVDSTRPVLSKPRRLSWRECAALQTFPQGFEPVGNVESKFTQIGNAIPPLLAEVIVRSLIHGDGLKPHSEEIQDVSDLEVFEALN